MTGHPDVESLAAYAAGDLTSSEAGPVAEHVVGCAACAADLAAIRQVATDLASLPPLPMPADVAASIDAALAAEIEPRDAPVVPIESRRRRSLAPLLTGAAAAALVGAIGYGVVSRSVPGASRDGAGTTAAEQAAPPVDTKVFSSGYAYDQSNVEAGALKLLAGDAALFTPAPSADLAAGGSARPTATPAPTGFTSGDDTDYRTTGEILASVRGPDFERCLDLLREDKSVRPVAVDYAVFEGQPALVVVLPFRDRQYDVFVVTRRCGRTQDAEVLHFQRVSA